MVNENQNQADNGLWLIVGGILVGGVIVHWWMKNELTKKDRELVKSEREKQLLEEEFKLAIDINKKKN